MSNPRKQEISLFPPTSGEGLKETRNKNRSLELGGKFTGQTNYGKPSSCDLVFFFFYKPEDRATVGFLAVWTRVRRGHPRHGAALLTTLSTVGPLSWPPEEPGPSR